MIPIKIIQRKKLNDLRNKADNFANEIEIVAQFIQNLQIESLSLKDIQTLPLSSKLTQALDNMLIKILKINELEKQRNWSTEGFAKFSEILRANHSDLKILSNQLISELVNYLGAIQAGMFIYNEESDNTKVLELMACYAYNRKKFLRKTISINQEFAEDLVTQAFLEKRSIYLRDIPDNYLNITSGLGEANPKYIFIIPLVLHNKVYGVIELASFSEFEFYQRDFLEKFSESIASTIAATQINQQTKTLLRETQEQTEKLRAQEEEIRQNNEELLATQEEMQRRSNELDGQLNAIDSSTIIKAEFNMDGIIENVNPAFCHLFGYESQEIIGQSHRTMLDDNTANSEAYQEFWLNLSKGIAQTSEVKMISKTEEIKWLNATYSPVYSTEHKVHKVIQLAFDITEAKQQLEEIQNQAKRMQINEQVLRKSYQDLAKIREELKIKLDEIELLKDQEAQKFKEKDEFAKSWMNKALEKFKQTESELKNQLIDKNNEIEYLKKQLETLQLNQNNFKQTS